MTLHYGVICYWRYEAPEKPDRHAKLWHLVESYPIDQDGYALSPGKDDREPWVNWTHKKKVDSDNWEYIPGRAVTCWTMEGGVRLLDLHPPKFEPWMSVCFVESLKKLPNWCDFLENGYCFILETTQAARKLLET